MDHRTDNPANKDPAASTVQSKTAEPVKYELPIDFEDIVAVAILDSILKVKPRRSRSRGATRRPRL
jgi:hypothetical protein